jgi:hypothetical protein
MTAISSRPSITSRSSESGLDFSRYTAYFDVSVAIEIVRGDKSVTVIFARQHSMGFVGSA